MQLYWNNIKGSLLSREQTLIKSLGIQEDSASLMTEVSVCSIEEMEIRGKSQQLEDERLTGQYEGMSDHGLLMIHRTEVKQKESERACEMYL